MPPKKSSRPSPRAVSAQGDHDRPSIADWRALYGAASRVSDMKPWTWMEEADVFGVEDPVSGEVGFVSITGILGEHLSVTVYRGVDALYQFLAIQDDDDVDLRSSPERILEIPQLQASFESRQLLEPRDLLIIRTLGLRVLGAQGWPMFRSWVPGMMPWFVDVNEARFLTLVLGQVVDVARRFREDESVIYVGSGDEFLVRSAEQKGGKLAWKDHSARIPQPPPTPIVIEPPSEEVMDRLRHVARGAGPVLADLFIVPGSIGGKGKRTGLIYMLILVDAATGSTVGHEALMAEPSLEATLASLTGRMARQLAALKLLPSEIRMRSVRLYERVEPLAAVAGIKLTMTSEMDLVDEARASLEGFLVRR